MQKLFYLYLSVSLSASVIIAVLFLCRPLWKRRFSKSWQYYIWPVSYTHLDVYKRQIQNLKPSPFCLLDEIEAALDDSNVDRYAKYLHKLTKYTQFIVITLRHGTMVAADRLYGITMQEKGVSTLVSVNLIEEDLDK